MSPRLAYPISLLSGALLSLAFPEPSLSFLTWFVLAPTLFLTRGSTPGRGALVWASFGFGFFGALLSWVSIAGWLAWAVLLVVQVPFLAIFGALWGPLSDRTGAAGRIALAGGAWAGLEYLRSIFPVGGFTWGQLAQSQHDVAWVLEWAALGGGLVLAGVLVAVNAAVAELARNRTVDRRVVLPALVIVGAVLVPLMSSFFYVAGDVEPLKIAIVQGNADPAVPQTFEKELRILRSHVRLTEGLDEDVDLVVWPESAIGIDPDVEIVRKLLARAATAAGVRMIVGGIEDVDADRYRVSAFLVEPDGTIVERYRKTHLVPFGEYVPFRDGLGWLPILDQVPRDAVAGEAGALFSIEGIDVAPVISYEGDFGSLVRSRIAAGGDILLVATNTSTWLHTWASAQHVAFSQVRAAENATPVVHAAISGISAFVSDRGEVLARTSLYEAETLVRAVPPRVSSTPYTLLGDWILLGSIVLCGVAWGASRRRREVGVASRDA